MFKIKEKYLGVTADNSEFHEISPIPSPRINLSKVYGLGQTLISQEKIGKILQPSLKFLRLNQPIIHSHLLEHPLCLFQVFQGLVSLAPIG